MCQYPEYISNSLPDSLEEREWHITLIPRLDQDQLSYEEQLMETVGAFLREKGGDYNRYLVYNFQTMNGIDKIEAESCYYGEQ